MTHLVIPFRPVSRAGGGDADGFRLIEESIHRFDELGDAWGSAYAKRWMGSSLELWGDAEDPISLQRQSAAEFERLGDRWSAAWISGTVGYNLVSVGELKEAQNYLEASLELVADTEDVFVLPHAKRGLGVVASRQGSLDTAQSILSEALTLFARIGDESCTSITHMHLGEVQIGLGKQDQARTELAPSLEGFRAQGDLNFIAASIRLIGELDIASGATERGARLFGAADSLRQRTGRSLSPDEQERHQVSIATARRTLGDEFDQMRNDGAGWGTEESIDYALSTRDLPSDADRTIEVPRPSPVIPTSAPSTPLQWPESYASIKEPVMAAWGVKGDVLLHRALGGKSGAAVFSVDVNCDGFSGQAILKLDAVEAGGGEDEEATRHRLAASLAPEYANQHLPQIVHSFSTDDHSVTLSTIAARGLEYSSPWSTSPYQGQLETSRRLGEDLLDAWNTDYSLAESMLTPQDVLRGWLDYRLLPERGRVFPLLSQCGVDPLCSTLFYEGDWYPNPVAFATGAHPGPEPLALRPISGSTHGDLHGLNVLVTEAQDAIEYFLIDLAFYEPDAFLFFDHAYFELNHLLEARSSVDLAAWMAIIDTVAGRAAPGSDDLGLVSLTSAMRGGIESWIDRREPNRLSYMESQTLLARVAVGLNFAHKRIPINLKFRGLLYAMSSLKEYLEFHGVSWSKDGLVLTVPAGVVQNSTP